MRYVVIRALVLALPQKEHLEQVEYGGEERSSWELGQVKATQMTKMSEDIVDKIDYGIYAYDGTGMVGPLPLWLLGTAWYAAPHRVKKRALP